MSSAGAERYVEQTDLDPLESLEADLDIWRKTSFDHLLGRRASLSALTESVRRTRETDRKSVSPNDVRELLTAVVAGAKKAQPTGVTSESRGVISNPDVIREIFGLTFHSKNASTRDRQELAGQIAGAGGSWHSISKHNAAHVEQLATWLRDYLQSSVSAPEAPEIPQLIPRPNDLAWLHATYRELIKQGGGVFTLWGLAGMGKTTLARQLAQEIGRPQLSGLIRVGRRGFYEVDIERVLKLEGQDVTGCGPEQAVGVFRDAARRLKVVRLLILDNVETMDDVSDLLPYGCNVPVLVTARGRVPVSDLRGEDARPPARQITPLPKQATTDYLRSQLPNLSTETAAQLGDVIGGHAETVDRVVHCLAAPDPPLPEELLVSLSRGSSQTLSRLQEMRNAPQSLNVVVRELYKQVAEDSLAHAILGCIVWTNESGEQAKDVVLEILTEWVERPSSFDLAGAPTLLMNRGLLTETADSFRISRLTGLILRDLSIEWYDTILRAYEKAITTPTGEHADKGPRFLRPLRLEYDFTRPQQERLAAVMNNDQKPTPTLICIDDYNWAMFITVPSGRRLVTVYRVIPGGILALNPARKWEVVSGRETNGLLAAMEHYYNLVAKGYKERKPEQWTRLSEPRDLELRARLQLPALDES